MSHREPQLGAGEVSREESVLDALRDAIARLSRGRLRPHDLDADAHLLDRGYLDSLSYVEFLIHVETAWGVRVPDAQFIGRLNTLRAMANHVAAGAAVTR